MPMLMPTPDELGHLSWPQRQRIQRMILKVALEADRVLAEETREAFGLRVMAEARALEAKTKKEPEHITSARRQALREALK